MIVVVRLWLTTWMANPVCRFLLGLRPRRSRIRARYKRCAPKPTRRWTRTTRTLWTRLPKHCTTMNSLVTSSTRMRPANVSRNMSIASPARRTARSWSRASATVSSNSARRRTNRQASKKLSRCRRFSLLTQKQNTLTESGFPDFSLN